MGGGQGPLKIGDGLPLATVQSALDVNFQYISAPPVLDSSTLIPEVLLRRAHLVQQPDVMAPWQLRPSVGEGLPVLQVAGGEAAHFWKAAFEIPPQVVNELGTPSFGFLPPGDLCSDALMEHH